MERDSRTIGEGKASSAFALFNGTAAKHANRLAKIIKSSITFILRPSVRPVMLCNVVTACVSFFFLSSHNCGRAREKKFLTFPFHSSAKTKHAVVFNDKQFLVLLPHCWGGWFTIVGSALGMRLRRVLERNSCALSFPISSKLLIEREARENVYESECCVKDSKTVLLSQIRQTFKALRFALARKVVAGRRFICTCEKLHHSVGVFHLHDAVKVFHSLLLLKSRFSAWNIDGN